MSEAAPPRYLQGYGLIEVPLERCLSALADAEIGTRSVLRLQGEARPPDASVYLSQLTWPATRLALFAVEGWTAVLTNSSHGSDFNDHQFHCSRLCQAHTIRVVDHPARFVEAAGQRFRRAYEARIFHLADENGATVRSVFCIDDGGRWDFAAYGGQPLPVEASFDYRARRKRDRFTHENLLALLAALGIVTPVGKAFAQAQRVVLFAEEMRDAVWAAEIEASACTPEQADDPALDYWRLAMTYVPHMQTHAVDVVRNLMLATSIQPALAVEAADYLDAARRQLGDT
jgi:hypothetical protein